MKLLTQVLDSTYGKPAVGVRVCLEHVTSNGCERVAVGATNDDGCIEELDNATLERGLYRIVFDCDNYFATLGGDTAFPEIVVFFRAPTEFQWWQVKIALAPYSYETYVGIADYQPGNPG